MKFLGGMFAVVFLALGCAEEPASIDHPLTADAAPPTCSTSEPPPTEWMGQGPLGRCGLPCDGLPVCMWCVDGPDGPEWSVAGNDACRGADGGTQDSR